MARSITIKVIGDASSAERALAQTDRAAGRTERSLGALKLSSSAVGTAVGTALGGAAVGGIYELGRAFVQGGKDAASYDTLARKLGTTLQSTGNAAGTSVKDAQALASSLESLSGVDEELILNSQNVLATFTNIRNTKVSKTFDEAEKAALNLSTTMNGDLQGATVLVGKALNDPIKGLTALSRAGVSFTAEQKATIKQLVATGDAAGAQKIILAELNKEFGGAAQAAGSGLQGDLARAKDSFSDLFRSLAAPALPLFAEGMQQAAVGVQVAGTWITGTLVPAVQDLWTKAQPALGQLAEFFTSTFASVREIVGTFITGVQAAWALFGDTILGYLKASWGNAQKIIGGALEVIKGVVDVFTGILTGKWGKVWDGVVEIVGGAWRAVRGLVDQAGNVIGTALSAVGVVIGKIWDGIWGGLGTVVQATFDAAIGIMKGAINTAIDLINKPIRTINKIGGLLGPFDPGDIPEIPKLADGGIVTRPTLALVGEAGPEAVIPLSRARGMGGGITIVVQGSLVTEREVVTLLRDELYRIGGRNAGAVF